jgi:hypothetical protein
MLSIDRPIEDLTRDEFLVLLVFVVASRRRGHGPHSNDQDEEDNGDADCPVYVGREER